MNEFKLFGRELEMAEKHLSRALELALLFLPMKKTMEDMAKAVELAAEIDKKEINMMIGLYLAAGLIGLGRETHQTTIEKGRDKG